MKKIILLVVLLLCGCQSVVASPVTENVTALKEQINSLKEQNVSLESENILLDIDNKRLQKHLDSINLNPDKLVYFEDYYSLDKFLKEDKTNDIKYSTNFTCVNYSHTLCDNAAKKGYLIYPYPQDNKEHMICWTYYKRGSEYVEVFIEPQSDKFWSGLTIITLGGN